MLMLMLMLMLARTLLLLGLPGTLATHVADVGIVDWHRAQLGVPVTGRTWVDAERQLVLAGTEKNVLAAMRLSDGSVAWRYEHEAAEEMVWTGVVLTLAGPTLRAFAPATGALVAEVPLHHLPPGPVAVAAMDMDGPRAEAFVLSGGRVQCVDLDAGAVTWTWADGEQTSDAVYTHIHPAPHGIYLVGLANHTLHITSLSPLNGSLLFSHGIPSTLSSFVLTPRGVAWLETPTGGAGEPGTQAKSEIRTVEFAPELTLQKTEDKARQWERLLDVGMSRAAWFVAKDSAGTASIIHFSPRGPQEVHTFAPLNPDSVSYVSAYDATGTPHIAQVQIARGVPTPSIQVLTVSLLTKSEGGDAHLSQSTLVCVDTEVDGQVVGTTLGFGEHNTPQLLVTTSTGTVHLFSLAFFDNPAGTDTSFADTAKVAYDDTAPAVFQPLWTRDEGLSRLSSVAVLALPESRAAASLRREEGERVRERWTRHIRDAQNLPAFVMNFTRRFLTGSYETPSSLQDGKLERDVFGFRKLIVGASEYGKVYALDSSTGHTIWSKRLAGDHVAVQDVFDLSEESADALRVVLAAVRTSADGTKDTLIYDFDALTGGQDAMLNGTSLFTGRPLATHIFSVAEDEGAAKALLLVDEERRVHVYPDAPSAHAALSRLQSSLHIPLRLSGSVTGHVLVPSTPATDVSGEQTKGQPRWTLASTWTHSPPQAWPAGELITNLIPRPQTPIATLGKVLGNRTTLYTLLNPHTFALTTSAPDACGVRVLDGVKGTLLYHARLPKPAYGDCDVQVSYVENWLVYVYWDPEYAWVGQSKGRRVVGVELYEGAPDERTRSAELSSFDPASARVAAYEQAYIFPHGVKAVTTSQTKFGVTSRDLIVATDKNSIQTFPRLFLNPRRPKLGAGAKPTTEMQEEMLIPYDAVMPDDPRRVVSHVYEVAGVKEIISSPSLLESTTVVFAYGLDLFGSRVAPSRTFDVLSPNFNKAQLVLTLGALTAGIVFVKPMVRRKKLRERWYVRG